MTKFKDFEIHIIAVVTIKGSDYFPGDWDGDEEAFRKEMVKEAVEGMRNANADLGDAWLDHTEEVTP